MRGLYGKFEALPLGSILPKGWIKDQLRIQADGFSGNLEEHWDDVGDKNGWKGGNGESWERGPYYLDGLLPLAYILKDENLIKKAEKWIEWTLQSQREDGSFGPMAIETVNVDVNKSHDWWHYMIMLKVLTQFNEVTGDERVVPFLMKFFRYVDENLKELPLEGWASARGSEMLLVLQWLYKRTGEEWLLELSKIVMKQSISWTDIFYDFPFCRKVEEWDWRTHVVNVAMGIKMPGTIYEVTGDNREYESVKRGIESLMRYHGQAHGMFSGDEWLSGTNPSQGVELCAVVEYMYSLENLIRIFGDGSFGDILEKVTFNALPGAISKEWTSHQYDQQVNQIICSRAERNWSNSDDANLFGLEPHFGCCTANMHQGWPKFLSSLWMKTKKGGVACISYVPCTIKTNISENNSMKIKVNSEYPFREEVEICVSLDREENFEIMFRIPAWCKTPSIVIDDKEVELDLHNGFAVIKREWKKENIIRVNFPMEIKKVVRNNYSCSIERGPLVYALPIKEQWYKLINREKFHDWEVYPQSQWKYAIDQYGHGKIKYSEMRYQPFDSLNSPVEIELQGYLVSNWGMKNNSAGEPPLNPEIQGEGATISLVPYGGTKLRIGEFPMKR